MTDDSQLRDAGWHEITLTTDSYPQWKKKGFPTGTHWDKGKKLFDQIGQTVPPIPPPVPPPTPPAQETITVAQFNALVRDGATIRDKKVVNADGSIASIGWTAKNVTLVNVEFDVVKLMPRTDGPRFLGVKGRMFELNGISNWEIGESSVFDGRGVTPDCILRGYEGVVGGPWTIRDSFFRNYYTQHMAPPEPGDHCQAIFLGSSHGGLVDNCHFDRNGNTAHIFVSSWGYLASQIPDVKIRNNTFGPSNQLKPAYVAINVHVDEIPITAPVCVQAGQPSVETLCSRAGFVKAACP